MHHTHPIPRAILLFIFCIVGIIVFSLVAISVCMVAGIDLESKLGLQIQTAFTQIGGFLLPALVFRRIFGGKSVTHFSLNKPKTLHVILTVILAITGLGIVAYAGEINLKLLEGRGGFIAALKELEEQSAEIMMIMLDMKSIGSLLVTILLVGLLPGICEEFLFRGALQSQLAKAFKNIHVAIWTTAIIFSAIHFQFFGFIPRMLLGALFGYVLIYTGSIWMPILAHFINNTVGVLGYYLAQNTDIISQEQVESTEVSWLIALGSAALVLGVILLMKKSSNWPERRLEYLKFPYPKEIYIDQSEDDSPS
jgi:membrane protease YdiL (CAAX protease family)